MPSAEQSAFFNLADGTLLLRQEDGSFKPVQSETDIKRLWAETDAEVEHAAAHDPDHPGLDDAFWSSIVEPEDRPAKEAISIKIDQDVLQFFRAAGRGYQTRINAVLRHYIEAVRERL